VLHERREGGLGEGLVRLWRRAWPPVTLLLAPLLVANTLAYWVYAPLPGKILPITLNLLGLSIVLLGDGGARLARPGRLRRAPMPPGRVSDVVSTTA
jgi:hypothetical protein